MNYRQFSLLAYSICWLLIGLALTYAIRQWTRIGRDYSARHSKVMEVLKLPWKDFFPITDSEMGIVRDLELDQPLFVKEHRAWQLAPNTGDLAIPLSAENREKFEIATEIMGRLQDDEDLDEDEIERLIRIARNELAAAGKDQHNSPIILYNQALLYLWRDQKTAAILLLNQAERKLIQLENKYKQQPPSRRNRQEQMLQLFEAMVVTQYALGEAKFSDPNTRIEGLNHYRKIPVYLEKILYAANTTDGPYARMDSPWYLIELSRTGTNTWTLWNDILAAYLGSEGYNMSQLEPQESPNCKELVNKGIGEDSPDQFRNKEFCLSYTNANGRWAAAYRKSFDAFYTDPKSWRDEHVLWAFSTWVNLSAQSSVNQYPLLLYNAALLNIKAGSFALGADLIKEARDGSGEFDFNHVYRLRQFEGDLDRQINKLHVVANVLVGRSFEAGNDDPIKPEDLSNTRALYEKLFDQDKNIPTFPSVHTSFEQEHQEREVDKWLFIHRWRELLNKGKFVEFEKEFSELEATDPLTSFFQRWRKEVMDKIAAQARDNMDKYRERGDTAEARFIQEFLLFSGLFSDEAKAPLKRTGKDYAQSFSSLVIPLIFCLLSFALLATWHSCHRALTQTFYSHHRRERLASRGAS